MSKVDIIKRRVSEVERQWNHVQNRLRDIENNIRGLCDSSIKDIVVDYVAGEGIVITFNDSFNGGIGVDQFLETVEDSGELFTEDLI